MAEHIFFATFGLIFLAELPDKTALAVLFMSARQNPFGIFAGAAGALVVQSLIAVLFGSFLGLLPPRGVHIAAGLIFCAFAVAMILKREEVADELAPEAHTRRFWKAAASSFVVVFLAEWGDMTQLATATLAAKFRAPVEIFLGATLALWCVSALAALLGHGARRHFQPERLKYLAAAAFALVGIVLLLRR